MKFIYAPKMQSKQASMSWKEIYDFEKSHWQCAKDRPSGTHLSNGNP